MVCAKIKWYDSDHLINDKMQYKTKKETSKSTTLLSVSKDGTHN